MLVVTQLNVAKPLVFGDNRDMWPENMKTEQLLAQAKVGNEGAINQDAQAGTGRTGPLFRTRPSGLPQRRF